MGSAWPGAGVEPQRQLERLRRKRSHSFGLIGSVFEASGKEPFPKGCLSARFLQRRFFQSLAVFAPLVSKATDTSPMKSAPLLTNDVSQSCNEI